MATGVGPSSAMMRVRAVVARLGGGRRRSPVPPSADRRRMAEDRAQHGDHVVDLGDEDGALLEEPVGALRARIERRARHREHLAALLQRQPRGDERAGALRRLDHDDAEREPGDQPVAAREIAAARLPAERHFGDRRAGSQERVEQATHAPADRCGHGRRRAPRRCRWRGSRGGRRRRCRAPAPTTMTKPASPSSRASRSAHLDARRRGVARADHGEHRARAARALAAHREQRRGVVDLCEPRRIVGLAERDEARRRARCAAAISRSASSARADARRPRSRRRAGRDRAARRAPRRRRRND